MIRRSFQLASILLLAAPLGAQVGHLPSESPFEDLRGRMALTYSLGTLSPGKDPAGVGPRSGFIASVRYELLLSGPLWLQSRLSYAPALDRTVKDPLLTGAARNVGTSTRPLATWDVGFGMNLTGNKSWHRVAPQLHGALGMATGGTSVFDVGGYRFGSRFTVSYGVGARIVTGSKWEISADITHLFWKFKYPDTYGGNGGPSDTSILGKGVLGPWQGNYQLSLGASRFFFR